MGELGQLVARLQEEVNYHTGTDQIVDDDELLQIGKEAAVQILPDLQHAIDVSVPGEYGILNPNLLGDSRPYTLFYSPWPGDTVMICSGGEHRVSGAGALAKVG